MLLSPDGEPVLYDSIQPWGCDHLFFPTAEEWAFVPHSERRFGRDPGAAK
jgi:hypothetical protein